MIASPSLPLARPATASRSIARLTYRYADPRVRRDDRRPGRCSPACTSSPARSCSFLHKTFAHTFIATSTVILVSALAGRLQAPARRDALVTVGLLVFQGLFVHALVISPFIAAFHPVNALLMFWWAVGTAKRAA